MDARRDTDFFEEGGAEPLGCRESMNGDGQEPIHIGVDLVERDAWLDAGNAAEAEVTQLGLAAVDLHGQEERGIVVVEEGEGSGKDADDFPGIAVDCDGAAYYSLVASE